MSVSARFRAAYAEHRAAEGRGTGGDAELLALPYVETGVWARHWAVRARSYEQFLRLVAQHGREAGRNLKVLDLGAGNGWLCYRLTRLGHHAVALDWRRDTVDGLGAAGGYRGYLDEMFPRVSAAFQEIPLAAARFDLAVFNASLHYSVDLGQVLGEAVRVTLPGGRVVILDSPFYARERDGDAMVAEKRRAMERSQREQARDLLALQSIEFLTRDRLRQASPKLSWRRHRVRYPRWYETRGIVARLRGRRTPSRFDLWEAVVS